jgi:hypothetical protein
MSILVGLAGRAGSGKDYTFAILKRLFPEAKKISFSDPLKKILVAADPYISHRERLSHALLAAANFEEVKNESIEVRRLLQHLGTDGMRKHLGEDVFVDAAMRNVDPTAVNVFTDVRFANEAERIRREGGVVVKIDRPGGRRVVGEHVSEQLVDTFPHDFVFHNDGDDVNVDDLERFVRAYAHLRRTRLPSE